MKKLLAMVLALVMTLSLAVSASAFKDDKDVSADYAEAVAVLNGMDVFKGYEDGSFKPQGNITRAEVATIIYRIYTGDVAKNDKSGLYSTYNKFSDMTGAGWAAGYIGYCANAELVKGYPDGTFKPSGNVTGYEVLAMILRAVGYDKNGEFSGADWSLNVAKYAEQLGILKNVAKTTNLGAPATRELVAEILFRAIQQPMVTYTPAFGYVTDKVQKLDQTSLGYKNFKLVSGDGTDDWGRPTTVWAKDANANAKYDEKDTTEYATVVATPDAAFHVATTECDICEALGIKKTDKIVEIYDNGKLTKDTDTLTATETKATLGDQGQQIEFYELKDGGYRMVIIDTYLAKVNDVVTEKVDSKNHVTRDDYLELRVFDAKTATEDTYTTQWVAGNDYAEGDYVLVNVNKSATTKIILSNNASASVKPLVEVVGKADSFEGAQTEIWYKANKHTIDKTEYNDAVMFLLNAAGQKGTDKYTWFVDQYGNLIGCTSIDSTNYAVLKDIIWKSGTKAHAEATLVYMDGTEATAEVKSIDGLDVNEQGFSGDFDVRLDNAVASQGDTSKKDVKFALAESGDKNGTAYISTSDVFNEKYEGLALYKVETDKDGKVSLQAITTKENGNVKDTYVKYADDVTINPDSTVLKIKNVDSSNRITYTKVTLSDNTQFLVRETDDNDNYTYSKYTINDLPKYADDSLTVYYTVGSNGFVTRVYIKNATDESAFGKFVFVPEKATSNFKWIIDSSYDEGGYYEAQVYVDGELQWIQVNEETGLLLNNNAGKLFSVAGKWNEGFGKFYGRLDGAVLVGEDNDTAWSDSTKDSTIADYIYNGTLDGQVLESKDENDRVENSWRITGATVISVDGKTTELTKDVLKTEGVWVVSKETKREGTALYIFVGTKLKSDAGLDVAIKATDKLTGAEQGTVTVDKTKATLITVAFDKNNKDLKNATLIYTANGALSKVKVNSETAVFETATDDVMYLNPSRTVVVTSEDGTTSKTYTIKLDWTKAAEWVPMGDTDFEYKIISGENPNYVGEARVKDADRTISELTTVFGANSKVYYTVKNGAEVLLEAADMTAMTNHTVASELALGNGIRVVNAFGSWTFVPYVAE